MFLWNHLTSWHTFSTSSPGVVNQSRGLEACLAFPVIWNLSTSQSLTGLAGMSSASVSSKSLMALKTVGNWEPKCHVQLQEARCTKGCVPDCPGQQWDLCPLARSWLNHLLG